MDKKVTMTDVVPWVKWRFDRWRSDEGLRMCGLAARGLWADLLAIMHGCQPYGHLAVKGRSPSAKQIASMVGMTTEKEINALIQELEDAGVFSRSEDGLIYSRRMVRDNDSRTNGKATGALGGNPILKNGVNLKLDGGDNPPRKPREREREEREREGEKESDREKRRTLTRSRANDLNIWFERFWKVYPNKIGPDAARMEFMRAAKKASPSEIMEGLSRYAFPENPEYHPQAKNWLKAGSWKIEPNTLPLTVAVKATNGTSGDIRDTNTSAGSVLRTLDILSPNIPQNGKDYDR